LATVWAVLDDPTESVGPIAHVQKNVSRVTGAGGRRSAERTAGWLRGDAQLDCNISREAGAELSNLNLKGVGAGSQPFVLWKDKQYAIHRMTYGPRRVAN